MESITSRLYMGGRRKHHYLDEFLGIERAVVVSALGDGAGKHHTRSVDRLPSSLEIDSSSDFLDQHRREAFRAQLLVHTEKVDLCHICADSMDANLGRNGGDKGHQLMILRVPNTNDPVLEVAWRSQRPLKEGLRVVKPTQRIRDLFFWRKNN